MNKIKNIVSLFFVAWVAAYPAVLMSSWFLAASGWGLPENYGSFQAWYGLAMLGVGWAYCVRFIREFPLWMVGGALALSLITAASSMQVDRMTGIVTWLRMQIWIVMVPLTMDLVQSKKISAGLLKAIFGGVVVWSGVILLDTAVAGGQHCVDHRVWEIGGFLTRSHELSFLVVLLPFLLFVFLMSPLRLVRAVALALLVLYVALIGLTFVRSAWLGVISFALVLVVKGRKNRALFLSGLGMLLCFTAFILATLPSQRERFRAEIDVHSVVREVWKAPRTVTLPIESPDDPTVVPVDKTSQPKSLTTLWQKRDVLAVYLRRMGSGRLGIWTHHLRHWWRAPLVYQLFGRGPFAAERYGQVEPVSDFIRVLMDMGLVGMTVLMWILLKVFRWIRLADTDRPSDQAFKIVTYAGLTSLIVMGAFSGILFANAKSWYGAIFLGFALGQIKLHSTYREN